MTTTDYIEAALALLGAISGLATAIKGFLPEGRAKSALNAVGVDSDKARAAAQSNEALIEHAVAEVLKLRAGGIK